MGKLAFGGYRVSNRSSDHRDALELALKCGCSLIETSSNYTGGESELLIGEVLSTLDHKNVKIISKAGYIEGDNLLLVDNLGVTDELVTISEKLKHSIHPDFLDSQLELSLKRLNQKSIESYLLHNPEYYLKKDGSSKDEMYNRIEKAFLFLESKVAEGIILSYGISSNTFIDPKEDHTSIDILKVLEIRHSNNLKGFKYIQFPLNLLELESQMKQFNGKNLFEIAKDNNLITLTNRPLNAFTSQGLVRLCEFHISDTLNDEFALSEFKKLTSTLKTQWNDQRDDDQEELEDMALYNQISKVWYKQASMDAVEQIFFGHFFGLLTSVWGRSLDQSEAQPFYDLYDLAKVFTQKNIDTRAKEFKAVAIESGLIQDEAKDLQSLAIDKYFDLGADYVLCGLKSSAYVENLKSYF
jgi:aryl-alcohol dehydrogenase-like predicted oxidoreductase